jgi:uncharacterized membrane protein
VVVLEFSTAKNLGLGGSIAFIIGILVSVIIGILVSVVVGVILVALRDLPRVINIMDIAVIASIFMDITVITIIYVAVIFGLSFLELLLMPVGVILVLVALNDLSEVYGDKRIFRDALGATIAIILSWILFLFVFLVTAVRGLLGAMEGEQRVIGSLGVSAIVSILVVVAVAVSTLLWYRALGALSARSGVGMFRGAAIFYAISAAIFVVGLLLTVMLIGIFLKGVLIGIFIVLVAEVVNLVSFILLALGFSSLKPPVTQAPQGME